MKNSPQFKILMLMGGLVVLLGVMAFVSKTPESQTEATEFSMVGRIVCLPHKNSEGPQTMECAFGFQDQQGKYYSLHDTDPEYKNVSNAPMNVPVRVSGTFTLKEDDKYKSIGVIDVTSLTVVQ